MRYLPVNPIALTMDGTNNAYVSDVLCRNFGKLPITLTTADLPALRDILGRYPYPVYKEITIAVLTYGSIEVNI